MSASRPLVRAITARQQLEGGGFVVPIEEPIADDQGDRMGRSSADPWSLSMCAP